MQAEKAEIPLLDHGYLRLIESWGSDQRIVESARMSTDRGFVSWDRYARCRRCDETQLYSDSWEAWGNLPLPGGCSAERHAYGAAIGRHDWQDFPRGDLGILDYLWKNKHSTPFEMAGLTIEVQAPIFVFREWHRHRVPFGYSELSARYTPMPNLNYVPMLERCHLGGGHLTKQAGAMAGADALTDEAALDWLNRLAVFYDEAERLYQHGLGIGLPKELARIVVPVGRYSRMRATGNLRGWLAFLALRHHPKAQYEIRVFAEQVAVIIEHVFPRTYQVALSAA